MPKAYRPRVNPEISQKDYSAKKTNPRLWRGLWVGVKLWVVGRVGPGVELDLRPLIDEHASHLVDVAGDPQGFL